jgi:hypothetical protein
VLELPFGTLILGGLPRAVDTLTCPACADTAKDITVIVATESTLIVDIWPLGWLCRPQLVRSLGFAAIGIQHIAIKPAPMS